ncbi:MAG: hypothetical protein HY965_01305 [Ignavibacteriales bacterium]|nr:hypothetical protein [Ignavibacteriales bacterium]
MILTISQKIESFRKAIKCLTLFLVCYNTAIYSQEDVQELVPDSLIWNKILNMTYPLNPATHESIKFVNGCYSQRLTGSNANLQISIQEKHISGMMKDLKLFCTAALLNADSGNGTIHTYLVAFLQNNAEPYPAASVYLGNNITLNRMSITVNGINIWWLRYLEGEEKEDPHHIVCRDFTLRGDSLVDDGHEESVRQKLAIENDTIYKQSIKTGLWTVKWNSTRAIAYNSFMFDTVGIYMSTYSDIEDEDRDYYPGDSSEEYFRDWSYYSDENEMLSVVGPYVSSLNTYDGSGGAHPIYGIRMNVFELGGMGEKSEASEDTSELPFQILSSIKNGKGFDVKLPKITDIFPEKDIFEALMKDSIITASLHGVKPANLKMLVDSLDGDCAIDFSYLLESFSFKSVRNKKAVVVFGLTHGCEVEKGTFTFIEIELPIPRPSE